MIKFSFALYSKASMRALLLSTLISLSLLVTSLAETTNETNSTVLANGFGITKDKALASAFRDAIKQYVGIILDSETILLNDQIIKDKILTLSNGSVEAYEILNESQEDGIYIVEIKAIVKDQNIQNQINSSISSKSSITFDQNIMTQMKNSQAGLETKDETFDDQGLFVNKYLNDFKKIGLDKVLSIKATDLKLNINPLDDTRLNYNLEYELSFNLKVYQEAIQQLEDNFRKIGLKEYPKISISDQLTHKIEDFPTECESKKLSCIALVNIVGNKFVTNVWVTKIFQIDEKDFSPENYRIYYEILNGRDALLLKNFDVAYNNKIDVNHQKLEFKRLYYSHNHKSSYDSNLYTLKIYPFFIKRYDSKYVKSLTLNETGEIKIDSIHNINDVKVNMQLEME